MLQSKAFPSELSGHAFRGSIPDHAFRDIAPGIQSLPCRHQSNEHSKATSAWFVLATATRIAPLELPFGFWKWWLLAWERALPYRHPASNYPVGKR